MILGLPLQHLDHRLGHTSVPHCLGIEQDVLLGAHSSNFGSIEESKISLFDSGATVQVGTECGGSIIA